jgi:superfamily II DNA or RNA helicase
MRELRHWQLHTLEAFLAAVKAGTRDFLVYASIGGGKTYLALRAAADLIAMGIVTRIIIVTYTSHLTEMWERATKEVGLRLKILTSNVQLESGLPQDVQGYVMTYAMLGSWPELHEAFVTRQPTLVIFDEIHHLSDEYQEGKDRKWTQAAEQAFGNAACRLSMSGYLLRSDRKPIAFVRYTDVPGQPGWRQFVPDVSYSYADAVVDQVCREVVFAPYDGRMEFLLDDQAYDLSFKDDAASEAEYRRLYTANMPHTSNTQLVSMLREANEKVLDLRASTHRRAAGLLIGANINHAYALAALLTATTGQHAPVVVSTDSEANDKIRKFTHGDGPWLVAVRMVSEGVDIPRLRVLVYCTQITADLPVMQTMGRIVRPDLDTDPSFMYFPRDERLVAFANTVKDDIRIVRERRASERQGQGDRNRGAGREYTYLRTSGAQVDNIVNREAFPPHIMRATSIFRSRIPQLHGVPEDDLARTLREVLATPAPSPAASAGQSYMEQSDDLRAQVNTLVRRYCKETGADYAETFSELFTNVGTARLESADLAQLRQMIQLMRERM